MTTPHRCCDCGDAGFVTTGRWLQGQHGAHAELVVCGCRKEGGYIDYDRQRVRLQGVPSLYRDAFVSGFEGEMDAKLLADNYLYKWPPTRPFFTLWSMEKGTGKTWLACAILNDYWSRHKRIGRFFTVTDLLERFRYSISNDDGGDVRLMEAIRRAELLVLDDLGAERGTDWTRDRVYQIVNERYIHQRPLVVTSNVNMNAYDERVASRLSDPRLGLIHKVKGTDLRVVK